jgi:ABC-type multidrug transport system fused ATPase/permease subunit
MQTTVFYKSQYETLENQRLSLKSRSHALFIGEIVSFLAFIGFLVLYTLLSWGAILIFLSLLSLVAYFYIRHFDVKNDERMQEIRHLQLTFQQEMAALQGDFSAFDTGERFADSHHPFTFDLDIFGNESVFQRISRCVTLGGSRRLADYLSFARIRYQASSICCLSEKPDWLFRFIAFGQASKVDTEAIQRAVHGSMRLQLPFFLASKAFFGLCACLLVGFYASLILAIMGIVSANLPIWWGILQFFLAYGLTSAHLKKLDAYVSDLIAQMRQFIALIHHCHNLQEVPETYRQDFEALHDAEKSFEELEKVLQGLDRRGNVLGLFFLDSLLLSDLFLARNFIRWQQSYVEEIDRWIDIVSEIDALVSMATYRFNHSETVEAEVVDTAEMTYEAQGLYHPFLGDEAVSNDFQIKDGNYYIITGANMAGKSTFLRAIGVNYVFALNGMPVFAKALKVSRFRLFSSMRTTDDLSHGISYFNAELLRLQQLLDFCRQKDARTLIILDEILKGTNSLDKLNGSKLFLEYVSHLPVSGVIATHDLELSKMENDRFHNYCFEIELGTKVTYSYKITPGVAKNQNATFLLKNLLKA